MASSFGPHQFVMHAFSTVPHLCIREIADSLM